jgi:hypothetical protein
MNAEHTECIWCGPNGLAWKPGKWVEVNDELGTYQAWSVEPQEGIPPTGDQP